jgi:hypothetical protein
MNDLVKVADINTDKIVQVLMQGDLRSLSDKERLTYYMQLCETLGLNPLSKPFEFIELNKKLTLYALKSCTDQLRKNHGMSITKLVKETMHDIYIVTAYGMTADGRQDSATGAVPIKGIAGEGLANAMMKAETKAKRRLTLSLAGLGMLDESEVDSIPRDKSEFPIAIVNDELRLSDYEKSISEAPTIDELRKIFTIAWNRYHGEEETRDNLLKLKDKRKNELEQPVTYSLEEIKQKAAEFFEENIDNESEPAIPDQNNNSKTTTKRKATDETL